MATATRAVRGATWGAAVGGVLGGLGVGVLASGLCDTGDCDGSFGQGFVVGMLAGGVAGGLAGLVVGSAFPEGGRALGGWSWTVRGGARRAGARDVDGMGLSVGLRALRPTTEATWVGVAAEYLGDADHRATFRFGTRDGEAGEGRTLREWRIASVRMVAARWLGAHPGAGGHLLAGVGLYPTWEKFTWTRSLPSGPPQESREHSFVAAPGLGVGAGWVLPMGGRWGVELGARADLLAGVGSDGWLPLAQATVGLRRGRRGG